MARVISMSDAINEAMKLAMRKDENVLLIGEDVAGGAAVDHLQDDEAWGGVLGVTKDSYRNSGVQECWTLRFLRQAIWERLWLRHQPV